MNPGIKNKNYARKSLKDLTGMVFNQLTVLRLHEITKDHRAKWVCLCTCGKETIVFAASLKSGTTRSCGCWHRAHFKELATTHGETGSPEYRSWNSMKSRCLNENNPGYPDYGGRGIKICDRWVSSFENFLADMGRRPTLKHTLGRYPDPDGDYEPSNCRWETTAQQARCKRTTVWVEYKGQRMVAEDFKRTTGITSQRFLELLKKMSPEQVVEHYKRKKAKL